MAILDMVAQKFQQGEAIDGKQYFRRREVLIASDMVLRIMQPRGGVLLGTFALNATVEAVSIEAPQENYVLRN